ncbi:MAG TPA: winged helix-turn-helix domain-containing protein [Nitrososphaera sp.]|jgi:predicted transcriptional regulator|nr:winged helix-turn-helix domain-containing protein [Nitrososphaera sp.]
MAVAIYIHHHQSFLQHTNLTNLVKMVHEYRDRVYIRKDVILKLSEYGELNQTKLMSYCGLNNVKHRGIIDDMVDKGLIERFEEPWGNKTIIKYKVSEKGRAILQAILEPYEVLFPRSEGENKT